MALPLPSGPAEPGSGAPRLVDPQGRRLRYLRVAVTDRCNLRCRYCMPAEGIRLAPRADVLSLAELTRLCRVLCELGIEKIRVTGGEPLVRKGVVEWLGDLAALPTAPEILLTTNGTLLGPSLAGLRAAGIRRVNLSLDSLRENTFEAITRRRGLSEVLGAIDEVLEAGLGLKINVVVLPGENDEEILDFARLTRDRDLTVRFIEPMPFSGGREPFEPFDGARIRARLEEHLELVPVVQERAAVDQLFAPVDHRGKVGIIEGHTRSFCGDCNRLRLDPQGQLRTCLYGAPAADLRAILRDGGDDTDLEAAILDAIGRRFADGHAAAADHDSPPTSMANIGG